MAINIRDQHVDCLKIYTGRYIYGLVRDKNFPRQRGPRKHRKNLTDGNKSWFTVVKHGKKIRELLLFSSYVKENDCLQHDISMYLLLIKLRYTLTKIML